MSNRTLPQKYLIFGVITVLTVISYMVIFCMLSGKGLFTYNPYNSYSLQADAWLHGRLSLPRDYEYLELAHYDGKTYVSFPPFPSLVMLPFSIFFGSRTPDYMILFIIDILAAGYLYGISVKIGISPEKSLINAVFCLLASNVVFNMFDPAVWFIAQMLCFTTAVMSIYYALEGRNMLSVFFLACSVGCRPMQILFLPVLLWIFYENKNDSKPSGIRFFIQGWIDYIPGFLLGFGYMLLNFARFKDPFEFGHNYLPEFLEAKDGQFSFGYVPYNLRIMFHGLSFEEGRLKISSFGEISFFYTSPIVLCAIVFSIVVLIGRIVKKTGTLKDMEEGIDDRNDNEEVFLECLVIFVLSSIYLFFVLMHKTMGAWQFGCRYSNDILPWIYIAYLLCLRKREHLVKYTIPFLIWGLCFNLYGTIYVYGR